MQFPIYGLVYAKMHYEKLPFTCYTFGRIGHTASMYSTLAEVEHELIPNLYGQHLYAIQRFLDFLLSMLEVNFWEVRPKLLCENPSLLLSDRLGPRQWILHASHWKPLLFHHWHRL